MPELAAYAEKAVLDWLCGGAAVTQPSSRYVALATSAPGSLSASEIGA